jgi:hypothetical protein
MRVESGSRQRCVERLQSGRALAVSLAIDKSLNVRELDDATLVVDLGRDETNATDGRMFSEPFRQKIDVAHAVENRKDDRLRPNGRGEIIHCRLERVGFHAEEDKVVRGVDLFSAYDLWREDRIAMWADDSEAISTELFRARWANEKSHIAPCLGQPATKVTTHRTGADDKDPHGGKFLVDG